MDAECRVPDAPRSSTAAWDYTAQAPYYVHRPNYSEAAIDELCRHVGARSSPPTRVVDVGAGTGNLTLMLLARGYSCIAVEPNPAMQALGVAATRQYGQRVRWVTGTGEATSLAKATADWFTMGSSFNTTDRLQTLREAHRVLRPGGYFSCLWNHRDIDNDPAQQRVEEIIQGLVPGYERGVRRQGQADIILSSGLFNDVHYIEQAERVSRTMQAYLLAWRSVRNPFWDPTTDEGQRLVAEIESRVRREFGDAFVFEMTYVTRSWTATARVDVV